MGTEPHTLTPEWPRSHPASRGEGSLWTRCQPCPRARGQLALLAGFRILTLPPLPGLSGGRRQQPIGGHFFASREEWVAVTATGGRSGQSRPALLPVRVCSVDPSPYAVQRVPGSPGGPGLGWGHFSTVLCSRGIHVPAGLSPGPESSLWGLTKPGSHSCFGEIMGKFSSVQSLSRLRLFATPWTAARQASLSITNSTLEFTHV